MGPPDQTIFFHEDFSDQRKTNNDVMINNTTKPPRSTMTMDPTTLVNPLHSQEYQYE